MQMIRLRPGNVRLSSLRSGIYLMRARSHRSYRRSAIFFCPIFVVSPPLPPPPPSFPCTHHVFFVLPCFFLLFSQVYEVDSSIRIITPSPTMPFEFTPSPGGIDETPAPIPGIDEPTPAPAPIVGVDGPGTPRGCFLDTSDGRIMTKTATQTPMGSAVSQKKTAEHDIVL